MRLLVVLACVLAGNEFYCSTSPTALVFESCSSTTVTVVVATGPVPITSWSPGCGMSRLIVLPDSGSSALWTVDGDAGASENPIHSGVRYGQTPGEARTVAGPARLERGVTYRVEISRLICEQGALCTLVPAGSARFQP